MVSDATAAPERDEFAFVPETVEACWRKTFDGEDEEAVRESLESLSACVDWCFNPPDDDADVVSVLCNQMLAAAAYIAKQPCVCDKDDPSYEGPCDRCQALGRLADERVER